MAVESPEAHPRPFNQQHFTNADDLIRESLTLNDHGSCPISRADASKILDVISEALKISKKELADKLSEYAVKTGVCLKAE